MTPIWAVQLSKAIGKHLTGYFTHWFVPTRFYFFFSGDIRNLFIFFSFYWSLIRGGARARCFTHADDDDSGEELLTRSNFIQSTDVHLTRCTRSPSSLTTCGLNTPHLIPLLFVLLSDPSWAQTKRDNRDEGRPKPFLFCFFFGL